MEIQLRVRTILPFFLRSFRIFFNLLVIFGTREFTRRDERIDKNLDTVERPLVFYPEDPAEFARGSDSIYASARIWVKGWLAGREFAFQEHHVDVPVDFNSICSVRSAACHSSGSSLEFDLNSSRSLSHSTSLFLSTPGHPRSTFAVLSHPFRVPAEYSEGVRSMDGLASR